MATLGWIPNFRVHFGAWMNYVQSHIYMFFLFVFLNFICSPTSLKMEISMTDVSMWPQRRHLLELLNCTKRTLVGMSWQQHCLSEHLFVAKRRRGQTRTFFCMGGQIQSVITTLLKSDSFFCVTQ